MSSYDEFDCYRGSCDYNGDNFIPDRSGHVSDNEDIGEDDNSIDKGNCSTDEGEREIDRDDHRVNKGSTDEGDCTNDEYDCGNDEGADCNNDESDCNNSEIDFSNDESDGSINKGNSDEEFSGISSNEEDNLQFDPMMFEPIYENAPISLCGEFCAIMEFKRSCNLSFSCIDRLLQLLQLFCPQVTVYHIQCMLSESFFESIQQQMLSVAFVPTVNRNLVMYSRSVIKLHVRILNQIPSLASMFSMPSKE